MIKVAVEEPFVSVKEALEKKGYFAEMLQDKTDAMDYDCVVVRDLEDLADFHMNVSLVEAKGRTLYEIVEEVEERLMRGGIIPESDSSDEGGHKGGGFLKGAVTGAIVGAAAGLLLTPKSGKEMQETLKEKTAGSKEKLSGTVEQVKGKVGTAKEKAADVSGKTKVKVDELKTKREEKKEEKEVKKLEKEVEKELKAEEKAVEKEQKMEEKAVKEHEKAEKKADKEIKKADKEAEKEKGGIEVVEFGESEVKKNDSGEATITSKGSTDK